MVYTGFSLEELVGVTNGHGLALINGPDTIFSAPDYKKINT